MTADLVTDADADALAADIAERLATFVTDHLRDGHEPHVVLTGGTIAIAAYEALSPGADWKRVHWWWGDERFVPAGHEDRNDQQARDAFLDRFEVPADHVHPMPVDDGTPIGESAAAYGAELPSEPFDLVLLGVGPDGHVASLFPGFDQLTESERPCVEVFDSPKPPPERITLTFPRLNQAQHVWFVVSGDGKADAVARAIGGSTVDETPAAGVHGLHSTTWLLDEPAASRLGG